MKNDKRIELVLNTVDEFKDAYLTGWSGAALHGRLDMLKEYGKYLLERVKGLPSDEFSGLHLQNVSNSALPPLTEFATKALDNIADACKYINSGNASHQSKAIEGSAKRNAEFIRKHYC